MTIAYVGLGSNLNEPLIQVQRASLSLNKLPRSQVLRTSSLYLTPPWGNTNQPEFINAVAEVETALTARDFLNELLALELNEGRVRNGERWGPRILDLDLLLYGDCVIDQPGLCIPHPRIHQRAFVLLPLAELAPTMSIPGQGMVSSLLARTSTSACRLLKPGR